MKKREKEDEQWDKKVLDYTEWTTKIEHMGINLEGYSKEIKDREKELEEKEEKIFLYLESKEKLELLEFYQ